MWLLLAIAYSVLAIALVYSSLSESDRMIAGARSFYGVLSIHESQDEEKGIYREMYHGSIVHGSQYEKMPWRKTPTTYYGAGTGAWMAIEQYPERLDGKSVRIGVIGLGTGTLSALGRQGDTIRFYEINPDVIKLSKDWFSYRQDSQAQIEIVLGDARMQLERELLSGKAQNFDVLIADAFSSDAIPLHMLSLECADIYRRHLKENGILAIHITNHYLDLVPVTAGLAKHIGWDTVVIRGRESRDETVWESTWVLITQNKKFLDSPDIARAKMSQKDNSFTPLVWNDEYSSLLHIFKFYK
jgi:hypothetical protein